MRLTVIIPARNEERSLPIVLAHIPEIIEIIEVLLVDGHSTDRTIAIGKKVMSDIRIIRQTNYGRGDAVIEGARAARGDYFLVLDAGGSHRPEEIPRYIEKAGQGFDLVKGSRYLRGGSAADRIWARNIFVRPVQLMANLLWRTRFTDTGYGMFLIDRKQFLDLNIRSLRYDLAWELMAKAARHKLKMIEIPARETRRISGHSHFLCLYDNWLIGRAIFSQFTERLKSYR